MQKDAVAHFNEVLKLMAEHKIEKFSIDELSNSEIKIKTQPFAGYELCFKIAQLYWPQSVLFYEFDLDTKPESNKQILENMLGRVKKSEVEELREMVSVATNSLKTIEARLNEFEMKFRNQLTE